MKTVYYNSDGTECDMEDYIRDCPTRAQLLTVVAKLIDVTEGE